MPDLDALNTLRLAKNNKNIPQQDFDEIRESVIERGAGQQEIRAKVKKIIEDTQDTTSLEFKKTKRNAVLRRALSSLIAVQRECAESKLVPDFLIKQISDLAVKLEDQLND